MTDDIGDLARELHDVGFAWNHTMPDWVGMRDEDRMWFMERAKRMLTEAEPPRRNPLLGIYSSDLYRRSTWN